MVTMGLEMCDVPGETWRIFCRRRAISPAMVAIREEARSEIRLIASATLPFGPSVVFSSFT